MPARARRGGSVAHLPSELLSDNNSACPLHKRRSFWMSCFVSLVVDALHIDLRHQRVVLMFQPALAKGEGVCRWGETRGFRAAEDEGVARIPRRGDRLESEALCCAILGRCCVVADAPLDSIAIKISTIEDKEHALGRSFSQPSRLVICEQPLLCKLQDRRDGRLVSRVWHRCPVVQHGMQCVKSSLFWETSLYERLNERRRNRH